MDGIDKAGKVVFVAGVLGGFGLISLLPHLVRVPQPSLAFKLAVLASPIAIPILAVLWFRVLVLKEPWFRDHGAVCGALAGFLTLASYLVIAAGIASDFQSLTVPFDVAARGAPGLALIFGGPHIVALSASAILGAIGGLLAGRYLKAPSNTTAETDARNTGARGSL